MISQLADFVSLIYPRTCTVCSGSLTKSEEYVCLGCLLALPTRKAAQQQAYLLSKFAHLPKVRGAYAYLDYLKAGSSQKLIHALKYQGKTDLGQWLGRECGKLLERLELGCDLIVPVPLHPTRLRNRG